MACITDRQSNGGCKLLTNDQTEEIARENKERNYPKITKNLYIKKTHKWKMDACHHLMCPYHVIISVKVVT